MFPSAGKENDFPTENIKKHGIMIFQLKVWPSRLKRRVFWTENIKNTQPHTSSKRKIIHKKSQTTEKQ